MRSKRKPFFACEYKVAKRPPKTPFAALLVNTHCELFQQRRQKDAAQWRVYSSHGISIYPPGYSEDTEREVMQRWYQQGYTAGVNSKRPNSASVGGEEKESLPGPREQRPGCEEVFLLVVLLVS